MAGALEVINNDPTFARSSSTSSAASPRARRSPTGIVDAMGRVDLTCADRHPPRRHQRRGGPPDPRAAPVRQAPVGSDHGRSGRDRRRPGTGVGGSHGHLRRRDHQGHRTRDSPVARASYHGLLNRDYGTQIVAGTKPRQGWQDVDGIPVYDTVAEAVAATGATASCIFIPAPGVRDAIIEAAEAGIDFVVSITEGVPAHDEARFYNELRAEHPSVRLLGPNCPGIISPGQAQHRHHRRRDRPGPRARPSGGRHRQPVGHADLPGALRAQAATTSG